VQTRQHPHAAPAIPRLLEQNFVLPDGKQMGLNEPPYWRSRFFDWKNLGVGRAAEFSDRTDGALWLSGETNERTKIDKRGVINARGAFWQKRSSVIPDRFASGGLVDWLSEIEDTGQGASRVGFNNWDCLIERERGDGVCGVSADPRQLLHLCDLAREKPARSIYDHL
jgi:hypothetical protein